MHNCIIVTGYMPKSIPLETKKKILEELLKKLPVKEIAQRYNVSSPLVYKIGVENIDKVDVDRIIKKGTNYQIRVTAFVKGTLKNKFIKDCLDKRYSETQMANHIFDVYYYIQDSIHNFEKIEPNKIKDYLKARIKL